MNIVELILIAQGWERKLTTERATRYWRKRQREDKGARSTRGTRRILERGYWRCFPNAQRSLRSGSGCLGSVRGGRGEAAQSLLTAVQTQPAPQTAPTFPPLALQPLVELILIAQGWERKLTTERATRYWRNRQGEDRGATHNSSDQ